MNKKDAEKPVEQEKRFRDRSAAGSFLLQGAIYGFIGKNGARKTTLLPLICGLQVPTSGTFSLYGIGNGDKNIANPAEEMIIN